jgi:hypothetical protein
MKGLPRSLSRGAPQLQAVRRQKVKLRSLALVSSGASGNGFGVSVAGDFPAGNLLILGAAAYVQFTKLSAGTTATFTGSYAVGSTSTVDATLTGTDANIIAAATLSAATAGVSPVTRGVGSTMTMLDNTDGSLELNLNLELDDASVSADTQNLTATGYIDLVYCVLGDD